MSDVQVEHRVVMTRAEVAQRIADVGKALNGDGTVSIRLADGTAETKVPDHVRFEAEVEIDGDEVDLELELKWSTARRSTAPARPKSSSGDRRSFCPGHANGAMTVRPGCRSVSPGRGRLAVMTVYEFRVDGRLTDQAREALCDMRIEEIPAGAIFSGEVIDESHLLGIVAQCRTLGLVVVSARRVPQPTA